MHEVRNGDRDVFPSHGARARRWRRFEHDLRGWLETPQGRFAEWRAREEIAGATAPQKGGRPA